MSSITLLIAGVVGYKMTHKGPPSFRRGGTFAIAGGAPSTTATSATAETTATTGAASETSATTGAPAGTATTASTTRKPGAASATTATTARPGAATPTTRAASGPVPTTTPSATGPAKPVPAPNQTGTPGAKPAVGTYTWAVDGTEGASVVGTRKFPDKMSMVVHTGPGLKPDQLVFDLTYSDKHAEREIVGFRNDGVYFDFEGGSITFGPRTETSQADYIPPILEVPYPLQAGFTKSGVTQAKGADGGVSRTEDWKTTVSGQEPVAVGGTTINAWKVTVERKIRPGSNDQGFRNRTMWFDPARNMWIKFVEVFHGERHTFGTNFTYDSNVTAVLAGFTA